MTDSASAQQGGGKGEIMDKQHEFHETEDRGCGLGPWRPSCLQRCASVLSFTLYLAFSGFCSSMLTPLFVSQVTSIEGQFQITSMQMGALLAANDVGFLLLVLPVTHFCKTAHIPRILALATFLYGVSGFGIAAMNFLQPRSLKDLSSNFSQASSMEGRYLCLEPAGSRSTELLTEDYSAGCDDLLGGSSSEGSANLHAVVLMGFFFALQGVSKATRLPLGFTYIDDNVPSRAKTGFYVGIVLTVVLFGPPLGFAFGGVVSSVPVDLSDTTITTRDPRWISAWWLGILLPSALSVVSALPIFFFPKHLPVSRSQEDVQEHDLDDHKEGENACRAGENKQPTSNSQHAELPNGKQNGIHVNHNHKQEMDDVCNKEENYRENSKTEQADHQLCSSVQPQQEADTREDWKCRDSDSSQHHSDSEQDEHSESTQREEICQNSDSEQEKDQQGEWEQSEQDQKSSQSASSGEEEEKKTNGVQDKNEDGQDKVSNGSAHITASDVHITDLQEESEDSRERELEEEAQNSSTNSLTSEASYTEGESRSNELARKADDSDSVRSGKNEETSCVELPQTHVEESSPTASLKREEPPAHHRQAQSENGLVRGHPPPVEGSQEASRGKDSQGKSDQAMSPAAVEKQDVSSDSGHQKQNLSAVVRELPASLCRLLRSPVYVMMVVALSIKVFAIVGSGSFLIKYLQHQFDLEPRLGSYIFGACNLIFNGVGTFLGGVLTSRIFTTRRHCLKYVLAAHTISTLLIGITMVFGCDSRSIVGLNDNDEITDDAVTQCQCDVNQFLPVCSGNQTFASPCYAGCSGALDATRFTNCSLSAVDTASVGVCSPGCAYLIPFLVFQVFSAALRSSDVTPMYIIVIRSVSEQDKSLALGLMSFVMSLIGFIPGPIVFGAIVDTACLVWSSGTCNSQGACILYDVPQLRLRYIGMEVCADVVTLAFIGLALAILLWQLKTGRTKDEKLVHDMEMTMDGKEGRRVREGSKDIEMTRL